VHAKRRCVNKSDTSPRHAISQLLPPANGVFFVNYAQIQKENCVCDDLAARQLLRRTLAD